MEDTGMTCMVADDHPLLRRGLATFLASQQGIRVVGEADSGRAVIALAQRRAPDVLVLDAHMPPMDGLEVCRVLRAAGSPTRVVVYSGDGEPELVEEALEAGATGFVLKGGPLGDLVRAVHCAYEGTVYVDGGLAAGLLGRRRARERSPLSAREHEVVELLGAGLTTDEMGARLFLSPTTVRSYVESAMHKLEARNRVQLVAKALRTGLLV